MSAKERILTIRLMDKMTQNPEYAKVLGITGTIAEVHSNQDQLVYSQS